MLSACITAGSDVRSFIKNPKDFVDTKTKNFWSKRDIFGKSFSLNYGGDETTATTVGGIFSMIVNTIVFFYFLEKIVELVTRDQPHQT